MGIGRTAAVEAGRTVGSGRPEGVGFRVSVGRLVSSAAVGVRTTGGAATPPKPVVAGDPMMSMGEGAVNSTRACWLQLTAPVARPPSSAAARTGRSHCWADSSLSAGNRMLICTYSQDDDEWSDHALHP
ncbi:hypothetical protein GCM10012275_40660 [Longimycelium tulufanense]|uniref:Uncharacterized protein n=2 Tax=Longimycelium tulufanense TaxID=907463 RepID=A0A8J3CF40_9PSEU|nr:hypothetical protein GCM10012275_40660 [Longimycelium tulufanense]